ncbi:hypothetical protein Tco_0027324 [Tanacetum coccineum]
MIKQGRELRRRESWDLLLSMASGKNRMELDPTMLEEVERAMSGLKKESCECLDEIINAPELLKSLLCFLLRIASGEGSSGAV